MVSYLFHLFLCGDFIALSFLSVGGSISISFFPVGGFHNYFIPSSHGDFCGSGVSFHLVIKVAGFGLTDV